MTGNYATTSRSPKATSTVKNHNNTGSLPDLEAIPGMGKVLGLMRTCKKNKAVRFLQGKHKGSTHTKVYDSACHDTEMCRNAKSKKMEIQAKAQNRVAVVKGMRKDGKLSKKGDHGWVRTSRLR
jgi:hypothetical protein